MLAASEGGLAEAGETFGAYRTERLLTTGGQAQIWAGRGPEGEVAIKVARTDAQRADLQREAEALRRVKHRALIEMRDASGDGSWLATERLYGLPLDKWARTAEPSELVGAVAEVVDALTALHHAGVVHGDVKPQNVLVDVDGHAKLLDLGVARIDGQGPSGFRGSPGYVAPEVLRGGKSTPASDIYGLGGLLYAGLTGHPPFQADDPAALAYLPMVALPEPPSATRPDLPSMLVQLTLTLLARDPARRPHDLARLPDLLRRAAASPPGPTIVGMRAERDVIRRAVAAAADGECKVIVLYGAPGAGRRTLISEAVEAARREGMPAVREDAAIAGFAKNKTPPVMAGRSATEGLVEFASELLEQQIPGLVLLHSDWPLPELARADHITPPPLSLDETGLLLRMLGADDDVDPVTIWRESWGHPMSIHAAWRRVRRMRGEVVPLGEKDVSPIARKALVAIAVSDDRTLAEVADELRVGAHTLLDHVEPLFVEQLIESSGDGSKLKATPAGKSVLGASQPLS